MNFCKDDLYFIVILLIIIYLKFYFNKKKENFQSIDDIKNTINTVYQADIEAVRNLSEVANQLNTNNDLKMPNTLKITNKLSTNGLDPNNMPDGWGGGIRSFDIYGSGTIACGPDGKQIKSYINRDGNGYFAGELQTDGNLILGGVNKWIFHTPDDDRRILYVSPWNGTNDWNWGKGFEINNNGDFLIKGNLNIDGNVKHN
jgi:hypothetical protein